MEALLRRASRVIVMAERGREILERVYDAELKTIAMIPHGVPNRPFAEPDAFKARFGWDGRKVVLTFGLLAPSKGIATMIERSEEHTSELQSLMRISYAVFCLKKHI